MRDGVSIKIRRSTYLRLKQLKRKWGNSKSFDAVITQLINYYLEGKHKSR